MNIAAHPCASPACITAMQHMPRSSYSPKSTSSFQSQKPSTDISLSGVQDSWILLPSPPHFSSSPPRRRFWLFWCLEVFSGNTSRSDVGVPDTLLLLPLLSSHSSFTLRLSLNQDNSSLQRGEREREWARASEGVFSDDSIDGGCEWTGSTHNPLKIRHTKPDNHHKQTTWNTGEHIKMEDGAVILSLSYTVWH